MNNTPIEIIFEECGWTYDPMEGSWSIATFKVSRVNLHKSIKQGNGEKLRAHMIQKLKASVDHAEYGHEIRATIERLEIKHKKS